MNNGEKLAAYEEFAADARKELERCDAQMELLRAERKTKTATYRQLFANRVTLREIVRRLAGHGL